MNLLLKTFLSLLFIGGFLLFPYSNVNASTSFGEITAGVVLHRADGTRTDLPGVTMTLNSSKDNNSKWVQSNGVCFGCRTDSMLTRNASGDVTSRFGTFNFTTPDKTGGWGTDFGIDIACGLSRCPGTDQGTCNPFNITASYPAGFPGGYYFQWAAKHTDPGWISNPPGTDQIIDNARDSVTKSFHVSNDSMTFVRFNFQANRAPTPTVQNPGTINIPAGSTATAVGFIGHTTDPDGNRGRIQIMYRRTTDANWTSFGTNNNAEGPDGRRAAIANGVSAPNITEWGWSWNSNPVPVNEWVVNAAPIYFPNVNLTAGTYQVAARAIDQFSLYGSSWSIQDFTVNPPRTITYVGNGHTGGSAPPGTPASVVNGGTHTVLGNTGNFVRSGYEFTGWNRRSNGTGDHYQAGGTITNITTNFNLYATWRARTTVPGDTPPPTTTNCSLSSFSVNPTSGNSPLEVQFSFANPTNANSWVVDFGNGVRSANNPTSGLRYTYQNPGRYTATLTCNPGNVSLTALIDVAGPPNNPPTVTLISPGSNATVTAGANGLANVDLVATVSDMNREDTVSINIIHRKVGEDWIFTYSPESTWPLHPQPHQSTKNINLPPGEYQWYAIGRDSKGAEDNADIRTLRVLPPPTLTCVVQPQGGIVPLGVTVTVTASNFERAPTSFDYDFSWDGNSFDVMATSATGQAFHSYQTAGRYTIRVRAAGGTPTLYTTCSPNPVNVRNPVGGDGGEVRP